MLTIGMTLAVVTVALLGGAVAIRRGYQREVVMMVAAIAAGATLFVGAAIYSQGPSVEGPARTTPGWIQSDAMVIGSTSQNGIAVVLTDKGHAVAWERGTQLPAKGTAIHVACDPKYTYLGSCLSGDALTTWSGEAGSGWWLLGGVIEVIAALFLYRHIREKSQPTFPPAR